jgi:hypothetical protein
MNIRILLRRNVLEGHEKRQVEVIVRDHEPFDRLPVAASGVHHEDVP